MSWLMVLKGQSTQMKVDLLTFPNMGRPTSQYISKNITSWSIVVRNTNSNCKRKMI